LTIEKSDLYKTYKNAYDIAYIRSFNELCTCSKRSGVMMIHIVANNLEQERARISVAMMQHDIDIVQIEAKVEELMAKEVGLSIEDLVDSQYSSTYTAFAR